ncbi:MAG: hypothetical protein HYU64_03405 [Armatimonadetes bacterium]|nr:hypothetical protein [Armatimonadota bacterium]
MRAISISAVFFLILCAPLAWASGGIISGTVIAKGVKSTTSSVTVANHERGRFWTAPDESLVVSKGGGLKYAVVSLAGVPGNVGVSTVKVDNKVYCFVPHVQAATVGSTLTSTNSDSAMHNVHLSQEGRTLLNIALPNKGSKIRRDGFFKKTGLVEVACNAHKWMKAFVAVFDHPYFAVTDETGRFTITNVPAGRHRIEVWHEKLGTLTKEVVVKDGGKSKVEFLFSK